MSARADRIRAAAEAVGTSGPEDSDDALATRFVAEHGAALRWTPGMDWMIDAGTHWRHDAELRRFDAARKVCRVASLQVEHRGEQRRLASAATVAAVIRLSQSDPRIVVPAEAWDANPMLFNTPGGVVDLRSGAIRPRRADDLFTQVAAVPPDFEAPAPAWTKFLREVFLDDQPTIDFLQRALGYCMTGDRREQKLIFLWGSGANGKSTLVDIVNWLLGTYALKLPSAALMQSKNERHPTELAQLRGKRLAVSSELEEGQFWAEARIKELTGDDVMTARFMRQDFFEFRQTQKHLIVGNYKPRLRGGDAALARRFVLVPFLATFEGSRRDSLLPIKLRAEASAILAWMIRGAVAWHETGLAVPASIRAASAAYMTANDDLGLWLEESCHRGPEFVVWAGDLYASFRSWKADRGEHAPSQTAWGERLALLPGVTRVKSDGRAKYRGIALKDEAMRALQAARPGGRQWG
jgi:putative DNA primase/helicase